MAFGQNTLPGDIFKTIGIDNIFKDIIGKRPVISQEYIFQANPEIILYGIRIHNQDDLLKANPMLNKTKAAQNRQMFYLNVHSLLRGSPTIVDKIEEIYKQISD